MNAKHNPYKKFQMNISVLEKLRDFVFGCVFVPNAQKYSNFQSIHALIVLP